MTNHYFQELANLFSRIQVTNLKQTSIDIDKAISQTYRIILARKRLGYKLIVIGNGGSASIASHIITDFIKNLRIPAIAFSDPSLLTCLSNDLGYEKVFSTPIQVLAKKNDILFAISSSGESKNILNAASEAKRKGCFVVTYTGFKPNNPLRKVGDINFYVPSLSYGAVEITHLAICHAIVDIIYKNKKNG